MAHLKYTEYQPPEQQKGASHKRRKPDERIRDDQTLRRSHPGAAAVPHRTPHRG